MAFKEEQIAKLTTSLAGDIELYNEIIKHDQELSETVTKAQEEITSIQDKLADSEAREQKYLSQISNLLSKIPIGETKQTASFEQQIEAIKNTSWSK